MVSPMRLSPAACSVCEMSFNCTMRLLVCYRPLPVVESLRRKTPTEKIRELPFPTIPDATDRTANECSETTSMKRRQAKAGNGHFLTDAESSLGNFPNED